MNEHVYQGTPYLTPVITKPSKGSFIVLQRMLQYKVMEIHDVDC
jgi:hypothetical protein